MAPHKTLCTLFFNMKLITDYKKIFGNEGNVVRGEGLLPCIYRYIHINH